MKPLREELDELDPNLAAGVRLLHKVSPLEMSAFRQRRIWMRLNERSAGSDGSAIGSPRLGLRGWGLRGLGLRGWGLRGWGLLRPALALSALLFVGAAGAMAGKAWLERNEEPTVSQPPSQVVPPVEPKVSPHVPRRATEQQPEVSEPIETETVPEPDIATPKSLARSRSSGESQAAQNANATLMMEALQARRSGDIAKARALVNEYRRKYPRGALGEEALALSIEVAAAQGDPDRTRLAREYLTRYPNGRFREQAQRVLSNSQ